MRPCRLILLPAAAVAWCGVLLQGYLSVNLATSQGRSVAAGLVAYFGFFTILTNLLVCASLSAMAFAPQSAAGRFFARPFAAGGVAVSIAFVSLAYHLLLRRLWNPHGLQLLADVLLHYVVPALYVLLWLASAPRRSLHFSYALAWGAYPCAYFVYALVRGELIGSYPYGFIDAAAIGYPRTLLNAVALLVAFMLLGAAFVAVNRLAGRDRARDRQ